MIIVKGGLYGMKVFAICLGVALIGLCVWFTVDSVIKIIKKSKEIKNKKKGDNK